MARLGASVLAIAMVVAPATAGDRALIDFLGYSEDGRYFAFEEFGVQDGSGFAYSTVYVVDLQTDKWMPGSPFKAQQGDDQEDRPLSDVRAEARSLAEAQTEPLGISVPVDTLAMLGDGVPGADGAELAFGIPSWGPPGTTEDPPYTLSLETYEAKAGDTNCAGYSPEPVKGYALTLSRGETEIEIHRDASVPKSRGCPLAYRLYAVVAPFEMGISQSVPVAIVSMYPFGFEGPDRRFLAVPLSW